MPKSSTQLYILILTGIYRHSIHGIYSDKEIAVSEAIKRIKKEPDDYHIIEIFLFSTEKPIDDGEYILTVERKGTEVSVFSIKTVVTFQRGI